MSSRRIETCPHKGGLADLLYVVVERRSIHRKAMSGGLVANHGKYTSLSNAVIRYQRADATYKFDNQALGRGKDFCIGSALSPFTPSEAANEIVLVYLRRLHRCERIQRVQGGTRSELLLAPGAGAEKPGVDPHDAAMAAKPSAKTELRLSMMTSYVGDRLTVGYRRVPVA